MHNFRTLVVFFSIISILFVGCTSPSEKVNEQEQISNQVNETDIKIEDEGKVDGTQNEKKEPEVIEQQIKYYVDKNYLIKPLDANDPSKVVLLTFDDAPRGEFTSDILQTLEKHHAKAIFFVNGHYIVKNKELLKEIYDKGHIIANHTWWHEYLPDLNAEKTKKEIVDVNNIVEEITGERPLYFRPPNGKMTSYAENVVKDEKMQRMNWSVGSLDWKYTKPEQSNQVVDQVLSTVMPGGNILMHDKEVTAKALDQILTKLKEQGYSFVLPTEVILD